MMIKFEILVHLQESNSRLGLLTVDPLMEWFLYTHPNVPHTFVTFRGCQPFPQHLHPPYTPGPAHPHSHIVGLLQPDQPTQDWRH